jgi:hypothetical protein
MLNQIGKAASMFKATILVAAIGAMTMLFTADAGAQQVGVVKSQQAGSNLTLVRDGCGRGRYYSERRGRCVDDDRDDFRGERILSPRERKRLCEDRCLSIRERCNRRRGGYFNGCGVEAAACIARCD